MIEYTDYVADLTAQGKVADTKIHSILLEDGYDYSWLMDVAVKNSLRTLFQLAQQAAVEGFTFQAVQLVKEGERKFIFIEYRDAEKEVAQELVQEEQTQLTEDGNDVV
jgi:hypothetical protein